VYLIAGTLLHKLAPTAPDLAGSLSSVVGNGVRWVKTLGQMSFGQSLVISGAGSQGLCALAAAQEAGVGPIVMLGLSSDRARFALARDIGIDHIVEVDHQDPIQAVPELIGGAPDVVIETSGVPTAIQTAIKMVRRSGRVVSIGLSGGKQTPVAFDDLVWRDITLVCGKGQAGNVVDAMRLINSGKYPFDKINNFHYQLPELGRALAETEKPPTGFIKGAVVFG
jgi:threonine dehydrogenase-like Zn-dependent dehydrogenase